MIVYNKSNKKGYYLIGIFCLIPPFRGRGKNTLLPLGLALPDISALVAAVIVTQTIVELISELIYIRIVPNVLLQNKEINHKKTSV